LDCDFNYSEEFSSLDNDSLKNDVAKLITDSQDLLIADSDIIIFNSY